MRTRNEVRQMPRKTILQVLHSLNVGGAEVLAAGLARQLSDEFQFVFACLDELGELGNALQAEGVNIEVLGRGQGIDWKCARRLRQVIKQHSVDLVHAHQYTPFFYALTTGILRTRPPVLFTEHGRFYPDYPRPKRMVFNRTLLRKKDRVIAVGEAVRQALIDNEGIPEQRTNVIYNGVDLHRFHSDQKPSHRQRLREELSLSDEDFVVTLVGRLDFLKDHLTAVRTAERISQAGIPLKMLFIGEGPERSKIETEIQKRQLEHCVRLLGTRHDVSELLQAADLCFLCSISEGIPLTLIEGMACSLPVVSTDVGGVAEVVVDGQTGYLAPAENDEILAEGVVRLARDSALREKLGSLGRQRVEEAFSLEHMHQLYRNQYREMVGLALDIEKPDRVVV